MLAVLALVLCATVVSSRAARAQQTLDLSPPRPKTLPTGYLRARIEQLNKQVHELQSGRPDAQTTSGLAKLASIRIRQVAAELIGPAASEGGVTYSTAALAGVTLADRAPLLDALFEKIAHAPQPPVRQDYPVAIGALRSLADKPIEPLRRRDDASVQAYVQHYLSSLLVVAAWADLPPIKSTWPARDGADRPALPRAVEQLAHRVGSIPEKDRLREPLELTVRQLRGALRLSPEFDPQVRDSVGLVARAMDFVALVERTAWLEPEVKQAVLRRFGQSLRLYTQPTNRQRGVSELSRWMRYRPLIEKVSSLTSTYPPARPLQKLVSQGLVDPGRYGDVLRWTEQSVDVLLRSRAVASLGLTPDLRVAETALRKELATMEAALMERVRMIQLDAAQVNQPASTEPLLAVRESVAALEHLGALPRCLLEHNRVGPRTPGLSLRVKALAAQLAGTDRLAAKEELALLVTQTRRFSLLPGEEALRAAVAKEATPWSSVIGDRARILLASLDRARAEWAAAWSSTDSDLAAAAERMNAFESWMAAADDVNRCMTAPGGPAFINRLAAVQTGENALTGLMHRLRNRVVAAGHRGASQEYEEFVIAVNTMRAEMPGALLLARLGGLSRDTLSAVPPDAGGALSELLISSDDLSPLHPVRYDLAVLSRIINEAASPAPTENREAYLHRMLVTQAVELSRYISARLDERDSR